jgi:hypothetical protein
LWRVHCHGSWFILPAPFYSRWTPGENSVLSLSSWLFLQTLHPPIPHEIPYLFVSSYSLYILFTIMKTAVFIIRGLYCVYLRKFFIQFFFFLQIQHFISYCTKCSSEKTPSMYDFCTIYFDLMSIQFMEWWKCYTETGKETKVQFRILRGQNWFKIPAIANSSDFDPSLQPTGPILNLHCRLQRLFKNPHHRL